MSFCVTLKYVFSGSFLFTHANLHILSFNAHANNGTRTEKLDKTWEERLLLQVGVVSSCHFFGRPNHFEAYNFITTLFESGNNITNNSSLNTIGLDGQKRAFLVGTGFAVHRQSFTLNLVGGGKCCCSRGKDNSSSH